MEKVVSTDLMNAFFAIQEDNNVQNPHNANRDALVSHNLGWRSQK